MICIYSAMLNNKKEHSCSYQFIYEMKTNLAHSLLRVVYNILCNIDKMT